MPKLCQKCHKNPAVVHFRAYDRTGHQSTSSYCLPCVLQMLSDNDTAPDMRQILQGLVDDLQDEYPEELAKAQSNTGLPLEDDSSRPHRHKKSSLGALKPKSFCHFCHRELELPVRHNGPRMKCGHCLTTLRPVLQHRFATDLSRLSFHNPDTLGMPIFCGKERGHGGDGKTAMEKTAERLVELLKRYHAAIDAGKIDGAELLKEELNCLRRDLTAEMRRHASSATAEDVPAFLALPRLCDATQRNHFWRFGWLPDLEGDAPHIRLASAILFGRTIVDWPMPKDASAEAYHKKLAEFLFQDPIFQDGNYSVENNCIYTHNRRLAIDCGSGVYCQNRSFYFEGLTLGRPGEGSLLLKHVRSFLRRQERRCTFFTDPEFGFYSPRRDFVGSCIYPMEFLHLPALCMLEGIDKIQDAVAALEGSGLEDASQAFRISAPEDVPMFADSDQEEPIGFLCLTDTCSCGLPLTQRVQTMNRVAKFLEKEELRARQRLRMGTLKHVQTEDCIARSLAILQNARLLTQKQALLAASRVLLGMELGCLKNISKRHLYLVLFTSLLSDSDYDGYISRKHFTQVAPSDTCNDSAEFEMSDLDQLGEVLWEDQDPDIALPLPGEIAFDPADPLGIGDIFAQHMGDPLQLLEHLQDALRMTTTQKASEDTEESQNLNSVRAAMIRSAAQGLVVKSTNREVQK